MFTHFHYDDGWWCWKSWTDWQIFWWVNGEKRQMLNYDIMEKKNCSSKMCEYQGLNNGWNGFLCHHYTVDWLFTKLLCPLLHSFSIFVSKSAFFCCTVSNSSLKSLHIVMRLWFCSFRWHITSLRFLLSVLWRFVILCEWDDSIWLLVASESGGEIDSRGVGFRYTSNALDLCDDWNDGTIGRDGSCKLSSFSNDCGWFRDVYKSNQTKSLKIYLF